MKEYISLLRGGKYIPHTCDTRESCQG